MSDETQADVEAESGAEAPVSARESYVWCGFEVRKDVVRPRTKPTEVRKWREVPI